MAVLIPNHKLAKEIGSRLEIDAATVDELIAIGVERYGEIFDEATRTAAIVVNGRSVSLLQGGETPLAAEDTVWLVLPAAGG
jgi:molybdopterin converting factor small subunit